MKLSLMLYISCAFKVCVYVKLLHAGDLSYSWATCLEGGGISRNQPHSGNVRCSSPIKAAVLHTPSFSEDTPKQMCEKKIHDPHK